LKQKYEGTVMFKLTDILNFFMGPRLYLGGGGGGAPPPTQTTVSNTNIPEYARPYVETMLGTAQQQLYNYETDPKTGEKFASSLKGYTPFNQDPSKYVAGFSPMQEQAFRGAANMGTSPQLDTASGIAGLAGQRAMGASYDAGQFDNQFQAPQDYQTGSFGAQQVNAPQLQDLQMQGPANVNAPNLQQYQMGPAERVSADSFNQPGTANQFMNPYMQNVVDIQQREAQRQADIAGTQRAGQAVKSGAFGGSRAGLMEAEAARNLATQKGDIQAQGQNAAFQNAQQQFNAEQNARMQAALANQGAGLTVGQQNLGAQLGIQQLGSGQNLQAQLANQGMGFNVGQQNLASRLQTQGLGSGQNLQAQLANQQQGMNAQQMREQSRQFGAGQGMNAAQLKAQYGLAGQQAGEQSRQFGAGYGMQGLQTGLQAAGQLGQLGQTQYGQQLSNINLQNQMGAQQQGREQSILNQQIQDYAMAQQYPQQQLAFMSNMLRGLPMQSTSTNMYQAAPSNMSQLAGLGLAGYGLSRMKKGGKVKTKQRPAGLAELALSKMA
jgi:hypothetical protein